MRNKVTQQDRNATHFMAVEWRFKMKAKHPKLDGRLYRTQDQHTMETIEKLAPGCDGSWETWKVLNNLRANTDRVIFCVDRDTPSNPTFANAEYHRPRRICAPLDATWGHHGGNCNGECNLRRPLLSKNCLENVRYCLFSSNLYSFSFFIYVQCDCNLMQLDCCRTAKCHLKMLLTRINK